MIIKRLLLFSLLAYFSFIVAWYGHEAIVYGNVNPLGADFYIYSPLLIIMSFGLVVIYAVFQKKMDAGKNVLLAFFVLGVASHLLYSGVANLIPETKNYLLPYIPALFSNLFLLGVFHWYCSSCTVVNN